MFPNFVVLSEYIDFFSNNFTQIFVRFYFVIFLSFTDYKILDELIEDQSDGQFSEEETDDLDDIKDLVEDLDGKIKDLVEHLVKDDQDLVKGDQDLIEGDQNVVEGDQDLIKDLNEQDLVEDLDGKIKDLVEHLVKDDQDLVKGDQKLVEGDQDLVKDLNDQDLVEDLDYDIKDLVKGDQDISDEMEESGEVGENNQYYSHNRQFRLHGFSRSANL